MTKNQVSRLRRQIGTIALLDQSGRSGMRQECVAYIFDVQITMMGRCFGRNCWQRMTAFIPEKHFLIPLPDTEAATADGIDGN